MIIKKNLNKAFSLIELSIVVLIIGILIAGVTQGSRLVRQSRVTVAKNLTQTSAVASIPNMVAWFETTSDNSITSATNGANPEDGDLVSSWNDINPESGNKVIVSSTGGLRPTYTAAGINNLPSVQFSGGQYLFSSLAAGGNIPLNPGATGFTFVAVWESYTNGGGDILDQNSATQISGKRAGIITNNSGTYGFCGESNDFWNASPYNANKIYASIITVGITSAGVSTVKIYDNVSTYTGTITPTTGLSNALFYIGAKASNQQEKFNGLISEVIIFERTLKPTEVADVKSYLAKKYGIVIL
jgi:prepilin-type N-terminal cleavage/methylation domain-containing protein